MGAGNAKQVYNHWNHLSHRAHRLLTYMALTTLDADDPPKYWAGRDSLADALGYEMPKAPGDDDLSPAAEAARQVRSTGHNAVNKVTRELVKAGALIRLHPGSFRTNATYALVLAREEVTPDGSPREGIKVTPQRSPREPLTALVGNPSKVAEVTPQRSPYEYEEKKGSFKGMSRPHSTGAKVQPKIKTLMNDSQSRSQEEERTRQMRELELLMTHQGKT